MVDPNEYQQLDNDWIDEFLEMTRMMSLKISNLMINQGRY